MARDSLIFILQCLGFTINLKKSVLTPVRRIEFLGIEIDSEKMMLFLPEKKKMKIVAQCQSVLEKEKVSVRTLAKIVGALTASAVAVLPAPLHLRVLQQAQIRAWVVDNNFEKEVRVTEEMKEMLSWWVENLNLSNGKRLD